MNKRTKKYLELENKWLWYHHPGITEDAELVVTKQYNKEGELVGMSTTTLPSKKHRPKHPNEKAA
ncbi:MAG TPA: hypothetical protein ENH82_00110 [bacterium]|nr:hypothetical protein [bacterium]